MTKNEEITAEFLRSILHSMQGGVFTIDKNSRITSFNRAAEKITGYKREEVMGKVCSDVFKSDICEKKCRLKKTLETGEPFFHYDATLINKAGDEIFVDATTSALRLKNNKVIGALEIFRDRTHMKHLQQELIQSEKLISLGQLAASVAHEVNNPLAGVLVYIKLLLKHHEEKRLHSQKTKKQLLKMEEELERISRIIRNLLDFSRQSEPNIRPIDINKVLDAALLLVGHQIDLENIKLEREFELNLPMVLGDFDQLQQVLINIILNAIQAMPNGGNLTIKLTKAKGVEIQDTIKNTLRIDIKDTGIGIPEENLEKLFTPFFTTKEKGKGVGLGLPVVHGIIERHKGKIEVKSVLNEGTTFTIYLEACDEKKD